MDFAQTIVALSTAPGVGAIAVVRLSGEKAFEIIGSIFRSSNNMDKTLKSHQAKHGYIYNHKSEEVIDEVVVTAYAGPNSYTGEDVIEISCHGNPLIARQIIKLCLEKGARLSEPGEFTRRAFLAGKLDLTQAEAVLDLIQAKTELGSQAALSVLKGDLGKEVKTIRDEIKRLLTAVVASIDFPDEVEQLPDEQIESAVEKNLAKLKDLARTAQSGKFLREGLKLAIVGRPNAGKSSLLNSLLKIERAIVTDIPGTTRDSLEEQLDINGIPVTLVDTAGMRSTEDKLEQLGIERTKQVLTDSQLVLLVADLTRGWQKEEEEILLALENKPWILVWNKNDIAVEGKPKNSLKPVAELTISAKTGAGIDLLANKIEEWVFGKGKHQEAGASLNTRQAILCQNAIQALQLVKNTLQEGLPHDCLTTDLKAALDALSEIAGVAVSEEVITSVFANFCLGK